uniref:Uncharacterized protein n=1 Tax=Quercus lobata TaxID=97700 RepID=A0A7N2MI09_QUELO
MNYTFECFRKGAEVPEIEWCEPGEKAVMQVLMGSKNGFLTKRLKVVNGINDGLIYLLPVILKAVDTFLEELIVRRKLADNFGFYEHHYDSLQGAWEWARKTLMDHASDE